MSGTLFVKPSIVPIDSSGRPLANATYTFYVSGTTTLAPIYADALLAATLNNPVTADSSGVFPPIWLVPSINYRSVLATSGGSALEDVDPYPANYQSALTLAEIAAGITTIDATYPVGHPKRHLAVLDGATDDTTALTNWAKVGGVLTFPNAVALISAAIPLYSNTTVTFAGGGKIKTNTPDISIFYANAKQYITVRDGSFQQTVAGAAAYVGGITFEGCNSCVAENNLFTGLQWAGVYLRASSYCTVRGNFMGGVLGTVQDSSDVMITSTTTTGSHWNVVTGNFCFGGGYHGILVQDPYAGILCTRNVVSNNRIGGSHAGYGISVYMPNVVAGTATAADSYNTISHNHIEGATGSINASQGAGIYIVGAGAGATIISTNTIFNCCINTTTETLAPAGIGVSGQSAGTTAVNISNNTIDGMTKYHGILLTGVRSGAVVSGNTIRMPATNTTGHALKITNSKNIIVDGNPITQLDTTGSQRGILIACIATTTATPECATYGITIKGNPINGGNISQIETSTTGGGQIITFTGTPAASATSATLSLPWALPTGTYSVGIVETASGRIQLRRVVLTFGNTTAAWLPGLENNSNAAANVYLISGLKIIGNDLNGGTDTCKPLLFFGLTCSNVLVEGNTINSGLLVAISQTTAPGIRYVGNDLTSTGATVFTTSGACTGSHFDKSNFGQGLGANSLINNAGSGVYVEMQAGAAPTAGTWAVGNRVEHQAPAVGNPTGWNCTVAGTPGTWVAWAVL